MLPGVNPANQGPRDVGRAKRTGFYAVAIVTFPPVPASTERFLRV